MVHARLNSIPVIVTAKTTRWLDASAILPIGIATAIAIRTHHKHANPAIHTFGLTYPPKSQKMPSHL